MKAALDAIPPWFWTMVLAEMMAKLAEYVVRSVLKPVRQVSQVAQELLNATGQVAAASQTLSQGATEQAASVEQTGASIEQMSAGSCELAALATGLHELVEHFTVEADGSSQRGHASGANRSKRVA